MTTVLTDDIDYAEKIDEETQAALRRMLGIGNDDPIPQEVALMHFRVKRMTDRLQLGELHRSPHTLALICVLAECDVAPFSEEAPGG